MSVGTVTIFTDISLKYTDEKLKQGVMGYAYFFACDQGKKYGSRVVTKFIGGTFEAEAYAIAFALEAAQEFYKGTLTKAFVYCDNKSVVENLKKFGSWKGNDFLGKMEKFIRELGYTDLDLRHIKGHTSNPNRNKRTYLNDRVDKLSREARRQVEAELEKQLVK